MTKESYKRGRALVMQIEQVESAKESITPARIRDEYTYGAYTPSEAICEDFATAMLKEVDARINSLKKEFASL